MADNNVNLSNSDEELNFTASMDGVCETHEPGKILSYMRNLLSSKSIAMEDGSKAIDDLSAPKSLDKLSTYLEEYKNELRDASRTAKLWLQYLNYIEIIKCFIRAERTGELEPILSNCWTANYLFAATGHINCAKSARLYLQLMFELPTDYPWLYTSFAEHGYHTVRRSAFGLVFGLI